MTPCRSAELLLVNVTNYPRAHARVRASDAKKILLARELYQACLTKALMFRDFGNVESWKVVNQPHVGRVFVANNLKVSTNLALALQIQRHASANIKTPFSGIFTELVKDYPYQPRRFLSELSSFSESNAPCIPEYLCIYER